MSNPVKGFRSENLFHYNEYFHLVTYLTLG